MKNLKDVSIRAKLLGAFLSIDVVVLAIIITSSICIRRMVSVDDPIAVANKYGVFAVVMIVFMLAMMASITTYMLRHIRLSSNDLIDAAQLIAEGKVEQVHIEKRCNDEFGEIVDTFQVMTETIIKQSNVLGALAEGDLTVQMKPKSEEDLMGNAIDTMIKRNNSALTNIRDASYQVMTSSSQVASASEALAQGSTEQASAIQQITASIDDIAEKTKQNAAEAAEAAALMSEALLDVNKGNQEMQDMVAAMNDINASSESISKIIKVIDDIAFQTNILALNAAVEAARAGDAGMGFAVVAEEVRNLAAKSASAAAETAEMIADSIHKIQAGFAIAGETAKALEKVSEIVNSGEHIVKGIAEASNYQATAIDQIDKAVEQVSQVVQTNSATSEECAAASVELSGQASRMRDMVSVFKLGDHDYNAGGISMPTNSYISVSDRNEQIISLKDGFGKY